MTCRPVHFLLLASGLALGLAPTDARGAMITTLFATNNQNSIGGANYFDINVLNPAGITVQSLDVNATGVAVGSSITVNVYTRTGTFAGFEATSAGWTLVSSGTGTSAGTNNPSLVNVSDFVLGPGVTGIAIQNVNYNSAYTNGTGTNQFYSNADLTLTLGSATNVLFTAPVFSPRVWNGTIEYTVGGAAPIPEPATLTLFGLGAAGLAGARWRGVRKQPA